MQFDLSVEEQQMFRDLAESALKELKAEIRRTSTHKYRDELKERETLLEGVLGRLSG